MGIKLKSDGWHIYSVIRDDSVVYEKNLMRILVNGVLQNYIVSKDIFCEVVHGNGAVNWYYKLGFYLVNETKNTYHLVLRKVNRI
jgi:homoaconitase/3-isopropylmalate dehydratase large subunit